MDHIVFFISNCVINYVGGKGTRYNMDIVFVVHRIGRILTVFLFPQERCIIMIHFIKSSNISWGFLDS